MDTRISAPLADGSDLLEHHLFHMRDLWIEWRSPDPRANAGDGRTYAPPFPAGQNAHAVPPRGALRDIAYGLEVEMWESTRADEPLPAWTTLRYALKLTLGGFPGHHRQDAAQQLAVLTGVLPLAHVELLHLCCGDTLGAGDWLNFSGCVFRCARSPSRTRWR
ncbi:hypothetical protein DENSPDRAFT_932716 [Dentipellis sp. KUC8613]|nr:hypothetical protein DENSPDRAFT_932716 [Dentipellis sp. KUC8613]